MAEPDPLEAFLTAATTATIGERDTVSAALRDRLDEGRAACPDLPTARLASYLGQRCPTGDAADFLERVDGGELAIACACADGGAAIARFEARYFGELRVGVSRLRCTDDELAEVTQEVRRLLFADTPPRLLTLTGRGDLRALLRLMALRVAISARRKALRTPVVADDDLELLDDGSSVGTRLARADHRQAFRAALATALAALSPRDRTLLRMHTLDGVPLAALATMHRVDRATISRWLAAAREEIYRSTRRALAAQAGVAAADFDSFVDVIRSQFDVSLRDALT